MKRIFLLIIVVTYCSVSTPCQATSPFVAYVGSQYWVHNDITYTVQNNEDLRLDVWYPHRLNKELPTLVYFHGGGWVFGEKEYAVPHFLPFLEKGWKVVNVEYRMAKSSPAPAAVEDTRCALRWVIQNADLYKFDRSKIVLMGHSAGGHLSLITGMLPDGTPLDNNCFISKENGALDLKVAAIINWYGITDVYDLLEGENTRQFTKIWLGSQPNAKEIAESVSPLSYVSKDDPPTISIHGDNDDVVPFSHSTRLRDALNQAGVSNQLHTVKGGKHGEFTQQQYMDSYREIWNFLDQEAGIKQEK